MWRMCCVSAPQLGWKRVSAVFWTRRPGRGGWAASWRRSRRTTSRTTLSPRSLLRDLLPACRPSVRPRSQVPRARPACMCRWCWGRWGVHINKCPLSREEKEEDEGRPLQAALQEELHSAAGGGGENVSSLCTVSWSAPGSSAHHHGALWLAELVREARAQLPVSRDPSLFPAAPSLLLRLWVPLTLYLHHLRGALL